MSRTEGLREALWDHALRGEDDIQAICRAICEELGITREMVDRPRCEQSLETMVNARAALTALLDCGGIE